jgi:hypothetical protein
MEVFDGGREEPFFALTKLYDRSLQPVRRSTA